MGYVNASRQAWTPASSCGYALSPIRKIAALEVPVEWTAGAVCSRHASATDQESLESIGMLGPANLQD
jgi:hypothetical protein